MKIAAPYRIRKRKDAKTYAFKLGETAGLSAEICAAYKWKSFAVLPAELAHLRRPRTKGEAESSVMVFIEYLKKILCRLKIRGLKIFRWLNTRLIFGRREVIMSGIKKRG